MGYRVTLGSYSTQSNFVVGDSVLVHLTTTNSVLRGRVIALAFSTSTVQQGQFNYTVEYSLIRNSTSTVTTTVAMGTNVYSTSTYVSDIITEFPI